MIAATSVLKKTPGFTLLTPKTVIRNLYWKRKILQSRTPRTPHLGRSGNDL